VRFKGFRRILGARSIVSAARLETGQLVEAVPAR